MSRPFAALLCALIVALGVGAANAPGGRQAGAQPPPPSPQETVLTADDIFHKAVLVTGDHRTPPFITYTMHEIFTHHGRRYDYDYRVWYRSDGKALMQNMAPDRRGRVETLWGYPFPVAPDINILLYATPPPDLGASPTPLPLPSGSGPPLLGIEPVRRDRYYDISLVGVEVYNGRPAYHLKLRALREQHQHPFQELWVDALTFEVWKAYGMRSEHRGLASGSGDAYAEFVPIGSYWLVSHAGGHGQVRLGIVNDSAEYEFVLANFGFPDYVPDWYFDAKTFRYHKR